jgi:hypothetical protein
VVEPLPPHLLDELRKGRTLRAEDARRQAERDERRRAAEEREREESWKCLLVTVRRDLEPDGLWEYADVARPAGAWRHGQGPTLHVVTVRLPGLAPLRCCYAGGKNGWFRCPWGMIHGQMWATERAGRAEPVFSPDLPRALAVAEEVTLEEKSLNKEV